MRVSPIYVVFWREFKGYFDTPVALICMVVFLLLNSLLTFYAGHFFEQGNASLEPFFQWHPWLYMVLMPAISMRLWAEERRLGTYELLMTLPIHVWHAVWGKFLAAWCFACCTVSLTFPLWITVNYLGDPDNGIIIAGYTASILIAGSFLAIGSCISALCKNQVIAFILSVMVCFIFMVSGFPVILNFFESLAVSPFLLDVISSMSLLTHFLDMSKGLITVSQLVYFMSLIALFMGLNILIVKTRRS